MTGKGAAGVDHDEALLDARARVLAARRPTAARDDRITVLVLKLGEERYGLEIGAVSAVVAAPRVAPLPGAPAILKGLVSHGGRLVAVAELARLVGVVAADTHGATLVVLKNATPVGVLVEHAEAQLTLDRAGIEAADGGPVAGRFVLPGGGTATLLSPAALVAAILPKSAAPGVPPS
jgi:chemotaxis signal transduction protein